MSVQEVKPQLVMVWPQALLGSPPLLKPAPGYECRTYVPGDEQGYFKLMDRAGFAGWNEEKLTPYRAKILPNGWFMAVHVAAREIVATAMATHNPSARHPFGGELGWVAGDPSHAGHGLGKLVCAAVTARFLRAGYFNIYLRTDDVRLPAINVYLNLGYLPFLCATDMSRRWVEVFKKLERPCRPEEWIEAAP